MGGGRGRCGGQGRGIAYWDAVAALNSPADMVDFVSSMREAGRADLDGPTLTARRDAFLQAAHDRLR